MMGPPEKQNTMPRRSLSSILLNRSKRTTLQSQLYAALRAALTSGALQAGDAVPSSRDLALDLHVSRNTVIATYDQLIGEGYLEARPRAGLFVNAALVQPATVSPGAAKTPAARPPSPRPPAGPRPFRPCQPDVRLFPLALWNRLRSRAIRANGTALLHYQPHAPLGLPALQRSLAEYLRDSRGVRCAWQQVAVTTGSQQALYLLAQLLIKPGSAVLMEDPGYFGARLAFQQAGAAIRPAPVDAEGLIPPGHDGTEARLIYTTPSRQFPTGACLPVARRLALVEWARKAKAWIIEDDYDSEFRYSRPPLPSLHSLDTTGRVIYIGSMSKVLLPALRIGYLVLPEALLDSFAELRTTVDDHGPTIDQATLADFIASGAFYTHIRRCRKEYGVRQETFLTAAQGIGWPLTFPHVDGGMNLTGFLAPGADDLTPSMALTHAGLDVPPLSRYAISATQRGLVFGFTAFDPAAIRAALKRAALHWPAPR